MNTKPVALVTGAIQGIGLQIAKDLVGHGFTSAGGVARFRAARLRPRRWGLTPVRCSST